MLLQWPHRLLRTKKRGTLHRPGRRQRLEQIIKLKRAPGQAIYEPFSGSGTTIIAAEMTGRSCFAIEIDPAYVDVAVLRWQAFTGAEAMLGPAGPSFAEVAAERRTERAG